MRSGVISVWFAYDYCRCGFETTGEEALGGGFEDTGGSVEDYRVSRVFNEVGEHELVTVPVGGVRTGVVVEEIER